MTLELTKTDKTFLRFETSLIENYYIPELVLKLFCQFGMKQFLSLPYPLEFIHVILPVEHLVPDSEMRIFLKF